MKGNQPLLSRHVGVISPATDVGYTGYVLLKAFVPNTLPDAALSRVVTQHCDALKQLHAMQTSAPDYDNWMLQIVDGQHINVHHPVAFLRREQASRAAHQITALVAAAHYDHFLHTLGNAVIEDVRKPPHNWKRTNVTCEDHNLGLSIGCNGSRVKAVRGSFNWDCNRPLSGIYVLYVPPSQDVGAAEEYYERPFISPHRE